MTVAPKYTLLATHLTEEQKKLKAAQKDDYDYVFGDRPYSKNLDYIALWFIKGASYIRQTQAQLAFVSTNSVTQGEHVGLMFPMILEMGLEIGYAYTSFKWETTLSITQV